MARQRNRKPTTGDTKLLRGDSRRGVAVPDPTARISVVAHVLYLGGAGRPTPFTSTTDSRHAAQHFAGPAGRVWTTSPAQATLHGAVHLDHARLTRDLTGRGKGRCKHDSAWEVRQARVNVELWREHLLDWSEVNPSEVGDRVRGTFS